MLSKAENSVAEFLKTGISNKEIADKLCVTEKTVKFHLSSIYKKSGVKSRAEFIAREMGSFISSKPIETRGEIMSDIPSGAKPINVHPMAMQQGARQVQVPQKSQEDKIHFIDEKFQVGSTITQLHHMMKEVTKQEINPATVNAACNCVARLNETINTAIQAARFLNER